MASDNWVKLTSFKSSQTILLFQKESRVGIVNILNEGKYISLTITVHPILDY